MNCTCDKYGTLLYYDELPNDFEKNLQKVDSSTWHELFKCQTCNQLWRIDIQDRLQVRFVLKIPKIELWQEFDQTNLTKSKLLDYRGGMSNNICIWEGCSKNQVKGVVYCIDHLYATGARR